MSLPILFSGIDGDGLRRNRLFEMRAIVGEEVAPHRLARREQLLFPRRSKLDELLLEVLLRIRMRRRVAAYLHPIARELRVNVEHTQLEFAIFGTKPCDVWNQCHVAVEHHIEFQHLV